MINQRRSVREGSNSIFYCSCPNSEWWVPVKKVEFSRQKRIERKLSIRARLNRQKQFRAVGFSVVDFSFAPFCFFVGQVMRAMLYGCLHTPYLKDQSVQTSYYRSVSSKSLHCAQHKPHK